VLSQCANTQCSRPFLRLREGKLFLVETGDEAKPRYTRAVGQPRVRELQRRIERFWLCDQCAVCWTLIYDREQGFH